MPESSAEISGLPPTSPLHRLRDSTIDIAKLLDPFIASLEDGKGFGKITLIFHRGELAEHEFSRSYKDNQ